MSRARPRASPAGRHGARVSAAFHRACGCRRDGTHPLAGVHRQARPGSPRRGPLHFESALKQDEKTGARRIVAAHLPLDLADPAVGTFGLGGTLTGTVSLPFNDATNPFVHQYHPDHDNKDARFQPLEKLASRASPSGARSPSPFPPAHHQAPAPSAGAARSSRAPTRKPSPAFTSNPSPSAAPSNSAASPKSAPSPLPTEPSITPRLP